MLLWSVEALPRCCVALPRVPEIYLPCIRGHCAALESPKHQHTSFTLYSPAGKETGKEGLRNHIKHTEMWV